MINQSEEQAMSSEAGLSDKKVVFEIPSPNWPTFQSKFEKLVKRAQRNKITAPSYIMLKEEPKTIQVQVGEEADPYGRYIPILEDKLIVVYHIQLSDSEVVIAGHEFVATIEHGDDGNCIHTKPGESEALPIHFRDCKPWCDHCKTLRRRNDTFVVRKIENNTFLQIGRNCLSLYFGVNAERFAAQAEMYFELGELAEASESYGSGSWGAGEKFDHLEKYLGFVAECIKIRGWKSRTTAKDYGGVATADLAYATMHPTKEDIREGTRLFTNPTEESIAQGKAAMEWAEAISQPELEASDYLYNINLIARRGMVGPRQYGFAASIVSGHLRFLGELKRKQSLANQAAVSKHVGQVGEKLTCHVLVEKIIASEGPYGWSYIHLMVDREGNRLVYFSSNKRFNDNDDVLIRGTVKAHGERNGVLQTILTRCDKVVLDTFRFGVPNYPEKVYEVKAESEKLARKELGAQLNVGKLPRGTFVIEVIHEQQ